MMPPALGFGSFGKHLWPASNRDAAAWGAGGCDRHLRPAGCPQLN